MFTYNSFLEIVDRQVELYNRAREQGKLPFYIGDAELGWRMANGRTDSAGNITADPDGFRITGGEGLDCPILSLWGDSIVQGADVSDADSWAWQLQRTISGQYRVLNGGVSAYGCDQALLRFEKSLDQFMPEVALLCYATTDLLRHCNIQRSFLHQSGDYLYLKPSFRLSNETLELVTPPYIPLEEAGSRFRDSDVIEFLKSNDLLFPNSSDAIITHLLRLFGLDYKFGPRKRAREYAMKVTRAIYDRFFRVCRQHNIFGCALLLPIGQGLNKSGEDFDILCDHFDQNGYSYIDPRSAFPFSSDSCAKFFTAKNHYSREGGEVLVREILEALVSKGLLKIHANP